MGDQQTTQIQIHRDQTRLQQVMYDAVLSDNGELKDLAEIPLMPGKNTALHLAVLVGTKSMTERLAMRFPDSIPKTNEGGDTALHIAAKSGQEDVVRALLAANSRNVGSATELLRLMNHNNGNTALHEAVLHGDKDGAIVGLLVSKDPEVAYLEKFGRKSPLYLAVEKGEMKILQALLKILNHVERVQGKSPLHCAIKRRRQDMLEEMLNKRPEFISLKDKNARNALHYAALLGDVEAIDFVSRNNPRYHLERDAEGMYPLHVACENGSVKAFQKLISVWPDPTQLFDHKQRNILHIAAKNGKDRVVRCILGDQKLAPKLINSKDIEGNTPLHLASMHGHSLVVGSLLLSKADGTNLNDQGLTPYEVAKGRAEKIYTESKEQHDQIELAAKNSNPPDSVGSMMTLSILFKLYMINILYGRQKQRIKRFRKEILAKQVNREEIKDRVGNLIVVATLIAGLAFAGITQMPKSDDNKANTTNSVTTGLSLSRLSELSAGSRNGGNKVNTKTSSATHSPAPTPAPAPHVKSRVQKFIEGKTHLSYLQIYTFFVTMALNASVLAAILLCAFRVVDDNIASLFTWIASLLVAASLYGLCIAFGFAALIGIGDKPNKFDFADGFLIIEGLYALLMSVAITPMFVPLRLRDLLIRNLYLNAFVLYYIVYRCLDFCFRRRKA